MQSPGSIVVLQGKILTVIPEQFGHGSRGCIGKNIALLEITKFVPEVLRRFQLEWASPKDTWTLTAGWFWKQRDVNLVFKSRDKH